MLLKNVCQKSGINNFSSATDFIKSEKMRLFRQCLQEEKVISPIKQMQLRNIINAKPYFVGVDAYLYVTRYKRVFKKIEYGFMRQIMLALSAGMIPVYVFDGKAPEQKRNTIINRQNKKQQIRDKLEEFLFSNNENDPSLIDTNQFTNQFMDMSFDEILDSTLEAIKTIETTRTGKLVSSNYLLHNSDDTSEKYTEFIKLAKKAISIKYEDIENLKEFLDLLKIPHITATNEADDMLAYLYKKGIIQACQSDDMDMLPKGCGNVIQISSKGILQFVLPDILTELKLNHNQFVDLCILLGSEYHTSYLPKINPIELYKMFTSHPNPSLESFAQMYLESDPKILQHLDSYIKVRDSFLILNEKPKNILDHRLSPINLTTIINYFKKIGICLSDEHYRKIKLMIKPINEFIEKLPYGLTINAA